MILGQMEHIHQPAHRRCVALKLAIRVNMLDFEAEWHKMPGYQDRSVALQRFPFRTHEGDAETFLQSAEHALQAMSEQLRFRQP